MGSGIFELNIKDAALPNYQFNDRFTDVDSLITAISRTIRYHIKDSGYLMIEIEEVEINGQ